MKTWREAVIDGIRRLTTSKESYIFSRQEIITHQLSHIINEVQSEGITPSQTLSRVLQELRDDNLVEFIDNEGNYVFLVDNLDIEKENLPINAIDAAIKSRKLTFNEIPTDERIGQIRQRVGQQRLRYWTLVNYHNQCALCDIDDSKLLIASHIARWTDCIEGRGDLSNVVCLCRWHDPLLEYGLISFTDDYQILKKYHPSKTISNLLDQTNTYHQPDEMAPSPEYLALHRMRSGF